MAEFRRMAWLPARSLATDSTCLRPMGGDTTLQKAPEHPWLSDLVGEHTTSRVASGAFHVGYRHLRTEIETPAICRGRSCVFCSDLTI